MPRLQPRKLTHEQFNEAARFLAARHSEAHLQIALRVLVQRHSGQAVANDYGISRQQVAKIAARVWDGFEAWQTSQANADEATESEVPAGWVRATIIAPSGMVRRWREELEAVVRPRSAKKKARGASTSG